MLTRRAFLTGTAGAAAGIFIHVSSASAATPGEIAVQAARAQIGVPYVWGGHTPTAGFDCSGLTAWGWAAAGVTMVPHSVTQAATFREVDPNELILGDLVFNAILGHVVIYSGNGNCIQAQEKGTNVKESICIRRALCVRPTLAPIRKTPTGPTTGYATMVAERGDSLYGIAVAKKVPLLTLARLNNLSPSSPLVVGDRLALPLPEIKKIVVSPIPAPNPTPTPAPAPKIVTSTPPTTAPTPAPTVTPKPNATVYVVRAGDTLAVIAGRQGTTVDRLAQLNGISNPDRIYVGQILRLPKP